MSIDQQKASAAPQIEALTVTEDRMVARRITVGLIPRVRAELWELMNGTQLGLTDVVNRAVSIYRLVTAHEAAGYELVFRHKETSHERVLEIL